MREVNFFKVLLLIQYHITELSIGMVIPDLIQSPFAVLDSILGTPIEAGKALFKQFMVGMSVT